MNIHLNIDTKTFIRFWLVVIGFALIALSIYSALSALIIIGSSLFLAIALSPSVTWLAKKFPSKSRVFGTAVSFTLVVLVLSIILFLVVPPIIEQTVKFIQNIPGLIDSATQQYSGVNNFINNYHLQGDVDKFIVMVRDGASQFASSAGTIVLTGIGSVISAIFTVILVLVLAFLMLVEGPTWLNRIWGSYKNKEKMDHHKTVVSRMYTVVTRYVTGQLSISVVAGIAAGIVVLVLCLSFNIPINLSIATAAIIFVLSLIPLFGASIGALAITALLLLNSLTAAIIFLIFFLVYQQVEGNYIIPKVQSKRIELSALAILVAVLIGITMFGVAGGIISIPIAGCVKILIDDYLSRSKKMKSEKIKTIDIE